MGNMRNSDQTDQSYRWTGWKLTFDETPAFVWPLQQFFTVFFCHCFGSTAYGLLLRRLLLKVLNKMFLKFHYCMKKRQHSFHILKALFTYWKHSFVSVCEKNVAPFRAIVKFCSTNRLFTCFLNCLVECSVWPQAGQNKIWTSIHEPSVLS